MLPIWASCPFFLSPNMWNVKQFYLACSSLLHLNSPIPLCSRCDRNSGIFPIGSLFFPLEDSAFENRLFLFRSTQLRTVKWGAIFVFAWVCWYFFFFLAILKDLNGFVDVVLADENLRFYAILAGYFIVFEDALSRLAMSRKTQLWFACTTLFRAAEIF